MKLETCKQAAPDNRTAAGRSHRPCTGSDPQCTNHRIGQGAGLVSGAHCAHMWHAADFSPSGPVLTAPHTLTTITTPTIACLVSFAFPHRPTASAVTCSNLLRIY